MKNKKSLNIFFEYDDLYEALEAHAFINYFALKNKIDPFQILWFLILFELLMMSVIYKSFSIKDDNIFKKLHLIGIRKIKKFEYLDSIRLNTLDYYEDIIKNLTTLDLKKLQKRKGIKKALKKLYKVASYNFYNVIKAHNNLARNPRHYSIYAMKIFYKETIDEVIQDMTSRKVSADYINITNLESLKKINIEELKDEIHHHQNILDKKLSSKQTLSYALKHTDHYLNALLDDKLDVMIDKKSKQGKIILRNTYRGYLIGFYEKGLLLSSNKRETLRELQDLKKPMKKIRNNEKIMDEIDKLIDFFSQDKRYEKYIPYKAIAKYTGMTKKQIKSLIGTIAPYWSYANKYEEIADKIKTIPLKTI